MLPARAPTALMWRYCVRWRPPWLASSPVRLALEASRQPGGAMTRHASRPSSAISSSDKRLSLQDQGRDWRGDRRAEAGEAVRAAAAMERSRIAQGSALRLRPRRLREQGFLGTARLRGRDVLLRAPQGGRLGRHQSDRDLRSTPGLDREPVSGTREGERLQRPCRAPAFRHARRFDPGSFLS